MNYQLFGSNSAQNHALIDCVRIWLSKVVEKQKMEVNWKLEMENGNWK